MNPYEVLGVTKNARDPEIRSAYRKLSAKLHPDKETGDRDKFEEVKLAHDVLTDPYRRKRYDTTGRTDISAVTPERVQFLVNETMRNVIEAVRPDGSSDDPIWENIRDKILLSITASRAHLKNDRFKMQRKLERCQRLIERFKAKLGVRPGRDCAEE
jgi:curved DNA-binding protein CbpA